MSQHGNVLNIKAVCVTYTHTHTHSLCPLYWVNAEVGGAMTTTYSNINSLGGAYINMI